MLRVTIFDTDIDGEDTEHEVEFVSFVNDETFGPPPLVAPAKGVAPLAKEGDKVLYINTRLVPVFQIERLDDDLGS